MAYYFITASKDASIYLQQPNQNTGLDEILEISKVYYGNIKDISRSLIRFELNHLSESISNNSVVLDEVVLILRETETEEVPLEFEIHAYPIFGSWEMGNGTKFDAITTTGVTWKYREGDGSIDWLSNGLASGSVSNPNDGTGGTWYIEVSGSQSFEYKTIDLTMDVKEMIEYWLSGEIPNDGFLLKYPNEFENNVSDYGVLKFFSKETNTIYQPKIRIGWDDQIYNTGSLQPLIIESDDILIRMKGLNTEYKLGSNKKLRLVGRNRYPLKTPSNPFSFSDIKTLPPTTYYQIKDFRSNDIIIPFGEYSKVSCDEIGNYIQFDFSNWEANRIYKLEFKIELNDDNIYYDDGITFNIVEK